MAQKIIIENEEWKDSENKYKYCEALENGNILFFPKTPFDFPQESINFLLTQKQGASTSRKNIAYKPQADKITNHDAEDHKSAEKLKEVLKNYSEKVTQFLTILLSPYAKEWKLDYASFRPFQEKGRNLRLRARNDLLHVDAFPTRPLHGARILRFFTNINPSESRRWLTSNGFAELAEKFSTCIAHPKNVGFDLKSKIERKMKLWLNSMGVKLPLRSPYDHFMLKMHNFLKENSSFQENCQKDEWLFPPGSCWAVFTDQVSHAALAGQYALEQTFLIPKNTLLCPEKAPLAVLERFFEANLTDPYFASE
jgi:hypothetical protein